MCWRSGAVSRAKRPNGHGWIELAPVAAVLAEDEGASVTLEVNRYFAEHPEMVLGTHTLAARRLHAGARLYLPAAPRRAAMPRHGSARRSNVCRAACLTPSPDLDREDEEAGPAVAFGTAATGATIKEGSYFIADDGRLMQIAGGAARAVAIKAGAAMTAWPRAMPTSSAPWCPVRDALRATLRAQASDQPWQEAQVQLRIAYGEFRAPVWRDQPHGDRRQTDPETGEERESHRRPNLAPFADDPDCWLVASIETYDLDSDLARMGPIFRERVIAPPVAPVDRHRRRCSGGNPQRPRPCRPGPPRRSARMRCRGGVGGTRAKPCSAIPRPKAWETADAYLSGPVRRKLAVAEAAAALDPAYRRNVTALQRVQPEDLRPSDIDARLGAPWIPTDHIEDFAREVLTIATTIRHTVEIAAWSVDLSPFVGTAAGTSIWGTSRRHAGLLLHDALNSSTPQIFDTVFRGRGREAGSQCRSDRGRQGKTRAHQTGLHRLGLDRCRSGRPPGADLQ